METSRQSNIKCGNIHRLAIQNLERFFVVIQLASSLQSLPQIIPVLTKPTTFPDFHWSRLGTSNVSYHASLVYSFCLRLHIIMLCCST